MIFFGKELGTNTLNIFKEFERRIIMNAGKACAAYSKIPECPDDGNKYHLVCENGEISWELVV